MGFRILTTNFYLAANISNFNTSPVGDFDFFRFFEFGQFFSKLPRATRDASEKGGKKAGSDPSEFTERACAPSEK